jgi:ATP-dependent Clp protease, protease subunit
VATTVTTPSAEAFVALVGHITPQSVAAALAHLDQLVAEGVTHLVLVVQTIGGELNSGMHLYERLRTGSFELATHGAGVVASMGIVIYLAGDRRLAGPACRFEMHRPTTTFPEGAVLNASELQEAAAKLQANEQRTRRVYEDRTRLTGAEVDQLKESRSDIGTQEAIRYGIAHTEAPLVIPVGQSLVQLGDPGRILQVAPPATP